MNSVFHDRETGSSLFEILVAIVIFAIGMLALSQYQGALTRASADAAHKTAAVHLAEQVIERRRGFGLMAASATAGDPPSYEEITGATYELERGGMTFAVTETVVDLYHNRSTDSFSAVDETGGKVYSDAKLLTVNVSWDPGGESPLPPFRIDADTTISVADMGSGEVTLSSVIQSTVAKAGSIVLSQKTKLPPLPLRPYTPGANPDVISISLGDTRFKESLTPEPRVITQNELVETTFDVITYSQTGDSASFLRREEFRVIACHCELQAPPDSPGDGGHRPTVWAGDEYADGAQVAKPVGVSINSQQSDFCDICCQDHHDGGSSEEDRDDDPGRALYDPWRPADDYWVEGTFVGDHKHYDRDRRGNLILADDPGDRYYESCRLVRKDGYWRAAQDLRREVLAVFPFDYLDNSSEVADYSGYVTDGVLSFVTSANENYPQASPLPALPAPASERFPSRTTVPTYQGIDSQQLRSRGIYIDYLSTDLREVISCLRSGFTPTSCSQLEGNDIALDRVSGNNVLELVPFFDVQLTWLTRWTESPANDPVEVTNEALATGNTHSRGVASRGGGAGVATVYATGHKGNLGLTDTDPIDPRFDAETTAAQLLVEALTSNPPPPAQTVEIVGVIASGVSGVQATKIEIEASDALCNRTPVGFSCWISGGSPTLTISNYKKQNTNMAGCSDTLRTTNQSTTASNPTTTFSLLDAAGNVVSDEIEHVIYVAIDACPTS
jgi:hypothetical protein